MSELTQTQADFEGLVLVKTFQFLISRRHDELWKDPSSLNMSSSGLSQKNLLAPLLVSKQSVSPGPSMSLCCYLVYLNLPPALHFLSALSFLLFISSISTSILCRSLRFCLSALFSFCLFLCHLCLLLSPLCQFHFSSHYSSPFVSTFFSITQFIFSVSRSTFNYLSQLLSSPLSFPQSPSWCNTRLQQPTCPSLHLSTSTLSCLASDKGEYEIYTYHTQVDWREGLWHRQIIERIQHVIQVIFLGERHKQQKKKKKDIKTEDTWILFTSFVDVTSYVSILTTVLGQALLQTRGQSCSEAWRALKHPTDTCLTSNGEVKRRLSVGLQTLIIQRCWFTAESGLSVIKRGSPLQRQAL